MLINKKQLQNFILDSGLVPEKDFTSALYDSELAKVGVEKILLDRGLLQEEDVRKMQAYVIGMPFVDLKNQKIDFSILSLIPEPIARKNNIIAFAKDATSLQVAMLDTDDIGAIDFVKKKVGLKILPRLTDTGSIKSALLLYQKSLKADFGDIIQKESQILSHLF